MSAGWKCLGDLMHICVVGMIDRERLKVSSVQRSRTATLIEALKKSNLEQNIKQTNKQCVIGPQCSDTGDVTKVIVPPPPAAHVLSCHILLINLQNSNQIQPTH